jgi:aspartate 1-decarboxylase
MLIKMLKSKIHRARITETHLEYEGSVTIDPRLMDAAGLVEGEGVLIANLNNGSRQETYVLKGRRGSGVVRLNGASARLGAPGDRIIIMSFAYLTPEEGRKHKPKKVVVDEHNRIVRGA